MDNNSTSTCGKTSQSYILAIACTKQLKTDTFHYEHNFDTQFLWKLFLRFNFSRVSIKLTIPIDRRIQKNFLASSGIAIEMIFAHF